MLDAKKPLLQTRNLSVRYGGTEKWGLQDISLGLNEKESVLLIGPTGCGKTTLLLAMRGIIPRVIPAQMKGDIRIGDEDISTVNLHQLANDIFLILQDPNDQVCTLVVEDDVAFALENLKTPAQTAVQRVDEALRITEMASLRTKEIYNLSGGQKQRVAIASGIALRPRILLLDAPTANLDPIGTREVMSTIERLASEYQTAVLIVEQKVDDLIDKVDRIWVMDENGRLVCDGEPRTVFDKYGKDLLEKLGLRIGQCPEIALNLRQKGVPIDTIPLDAKETIKIIAELKNRGLIRITPIEFPTQVQPPEGSSDSVVVKNLYFNYPDGTEVLRDVNFSVKKGDYLAIVGPNGGGKTTLCLNLLGMLKPIKGEILVAGLDTSKTSLKTLVRKIGYSFQEPERQLLADSVFEEIATGLRLRGYSIEEINSRVSEMLEMLHLTDVKDEHPFKVSMGEKRLLSVASILVSRPDVFILDEPITGQDRRGLGRLMDVLRRFNQQGTTIAIVTHDMNLVAQYASTVLLLHNGKVAYCGPVRKFFGEYDPPRETAISFPPVCHISRALVTQGISRYAITPDELCAQIERSDTKP